MITTILAKNIRRLRMEKSLTQEELALRLGITGQAVSRWERGECCPDIALLPGLANLFGVTADELLGMEELRSRERINEVYTQASELAQQGEYLEAARLMEQALKTFPNECGLMSGMGQMLVLADGAKHVHKAIALCEGVLTSGCSSEKLRGTTRPALCWMYRLADEPEKACELARNLPHCQESRELLWPQFMEQSEREAYIGKHLPVLLAQIQAMMDGKTMADEEGLGVACMGDWNAWQRLV